MRNALVFFQTVHDPRGFESILGIIDSACIHVFAVDASDSLGKSLVDRGPAYYNRNGISQTVTFLNASPHLTRGHHQKRRKPDCIGPPARNGFDDGFHGDLLAEIDDFEALVFQNGTYEVFPDIVHVAIDGSQDHRAPLYGLFLFQ